MNAVQKRTLTSITNLCGEASHAEDIDLIMIMIEEISDTAHKDFPALVNELRRGLHRAVADVKAMAGRMADS